MHEHDMGGEDRGFPIRGYASKGRRVVRPGLTDPEMFIVNADTERISRVAPTIPMQRAAQPEEIGSAIIWLLSDEASYVTGAFWTSGAGDRDERHEVTLFPQLRQGCPGTKRS
jgi:hypothetical protein